MRQVVDRPLWLGHAGDLRDPRTVLTMGIEAVVELADQEPLAVLPRDLIRCRFPLSDDVNNPAWLIRLAAETVPTFLRRNVPVVVCCSVGMSRSVCIAAAGVAFFDGRSFDDVVREIAGRGPADVSPGFFVSTQNEICGISHPAIPPSV